MKSIFKKTQVLLIVGMCMTVFITNGAGPAAAATKKLPAAVRVVLAKAGAMVNEQKIDQAIALMTEFQAKAAAEPKKSKAKGYDHAEIDFSLGTCYLMQIDFARAAAALEQAVKKDPEHLSAWLNLGRAVSEQGDFARAAQCFARAYELEQNPEHLYYSAVSLLMAKDNQASLAAFRRLIADHPDRITPAWRENFVHALITAEAFREALPQIRLLIAQTDGDKKVQWQEVLLQQYMQLEMHEEALEYAMTLTRDEPTRAKWWKALAFIHLRQNHDSKGLAALTIYGYLAPMTEAETKLLADLNMQAGIPAKAAPLYEKSLREKDDPRLLYNLMLALQQLGQSDQAMAMLADYSPDCDDPDLLLLKADLLFTMERYPEAAPAYEESAKLEGRHQGRAWLMAGYAARAAEDPIASRKAFAKAAKFEEQRKAALDAIAAMTPTERRPKT